MLKIESLRKSFIFRSHSEKFCLLNAYDSTTEMSTIIWAMRNCFYKKSVLKKSST